MDYMLWQSISSEHAIKTETSFVVVVSPTIYSGMTEYKNISSGFKPQTVYQRWTGAIFCELQF